jgi:PASTA domain
MPNTALLLPVDIPWKRIGVSQDMIDPNPCDRQFPLRWRSSVALFFHEPEEEYQTYDGMTISYLKVSFTITGFQPAPDEVGLDDRRVDTYWNDPEVIKNYLAVVSRYYPCKGAILEVAVAPSAKELEARDIPLSEYPYFADFEPKKRELYEAVSSTGEVMSRSLAAANVRKGGTTTVSHEQVGILEGFSMEGHGSGPLGIGGGGSMSVSGQWGGKDINQTQTENVTTTDTSREDRENNSHTTQLTQMYHQFLSYHLGTNRGLFFLLPRPHLVENVYTFVNGPRELEGIQDVFLTVLRPNTIETLCAEAYLETAHVANGAEYAPKVVERESPLVLTDSQPVSSTSTTPGRTYSAGITRTFTPTDGFSIYDVRIDPEPPLGRGFLPTDYKILSWDSNQVTAWARVYAEIRVEETEDPDRKPPIQKIILRLPGSIELRVLVFQRKTELAPTGAVTTNLWLTGRGVCACEDLSEQAPPSLRPSVTWEGLLPTPVDAPIDEGAELTIREANAVRAQIGHQLVQSVQDRNRYPKGVVDFAAAQVLAKPVASSLAGGGHPDDRRVTEIEGLDEASAARITEVAPHLSRAELLKMSLNEQADRFGLSLEESVRLRRAALGLAAPVPDPAARWPAFEVDERTVPDLGRLGLDAASDMLAQLNLRVGALSYEDSALSTDMVLRQDPAGGTVVPSGTAVALVLASGPTVLLPRAVGLSLGEALAMFRDAGLVSEPTLVFETHPDRRPHEVVATDPETPAYVTSSAQVTLYVNESE